MAYARNLVYAYANWIDPYFYSQVLEVFDSSDHHDSYMQAV